MVIKPEGIPQFTGNVDAIEQHAGTLKTVGGQFRDIGADTHNTWQGLSAFYDAPEADKLFAATAPIKSSADTFGGQVEWVGSALSQYASTIRPIVDKLALLKSEASCFAGMVNADEDWQEDEDKVNRNNDLIRQVDAQVAALMAAERTAANQINKLYGGTQWTVDDGTSQANMYGFNAGDIPLEAEGRPWGDAAEVDEPWYVDTWDAVWSGTKGFVVDGLWGTVTGLWGLVNPFDWDTFTNSWHGIWMLTGNVFFDPGATWEAWLGLGKAFVAWDEWEKDPARATGTVLFNVITLPFAWSKISKAGPVAKINANLARAAEVTKLSKIAELANAGKLAGLLKLDKIGLPTVRDLATQIDGAFKDVLARDPGLDAALRNADDLAARADTPTMRGDDVIGRTDELANARRPALVGVGAAHADDLTSAGRVGDDITGSAHAHDNLDGNSPDPSSASTGRGDGNDDPGSNSEPPDQRQSDSDGPRRDTESSGRYDADDLTPTGTRDKQYGLELFRDADGKLHFDGDREGTVRHPDGGLREKGRYATEDNPQVLEGPGDVPQGVPDVANRRAHMPDGDTPVDAGVRDAVAARDGIVAARRELWDTRLGPIADKLNQHGITMTRSLSEGRLKELFDEAAPHLSRAEMLRLERYGNEFVDLATDLNTASTRVGEAGGALVAAREFPDYHTLTAGDGSRGTSGNLDRTMISSDGKTFVAIEEKGIGSPLRDRWVENPANPGGPKIKAMQMSPEYLREMLQIDNKLGPVLQGNQELRAALQNLVNGVTPGTIRYIKVHTSESGLVTATDYIVDSARLGRDSIRVTGSN